MHTPSRCAVYSLLLLGLLASNGCSLFRPARKTLADQVEESFEGPTYILIVEKNGKRKRRAMAWKEGMTLQDVVKNSGVRRRFSDMTLTIKRPTAEAHRTIPLEAKYNKRNKRVEPSTDYAVHARDFVLISDASKGLIDEVIDSAAGVLFH